ncbi:MAG: aspartate aminotransferase family protein [Methanomassiliicoccales archaeon]
MALRLKHSLKESHLLNNYRRLPISFVRGKGSLLYDASGRKYVDMVAGIAVNVLGYSNPRLTAAICNQASSLIHVSNLYEIEEQEKLASNLASLWREDAKVFFSNSGAEANEAAIKFAIKHTGRSKLLSAVNSFHGRTAFTLSLTGQQRYWKGFEPILYKGVDFFEFGNAESVISKLNGETAAVIVEAIQGEGGVILPPQDFLERVSAATKENGSLLILDEVQTGMGRTGRFFAHTHWNCSPDIITMAKGLAGGLPIGATLVTEEIAKSIGPGDHGSTFGGNPLCTAAGNAVLDEIARCHLVEAAEQRGAELLHGLQEAFAGTDFVSDIRGKGLMIGIEMTDGVAEKFRNYALQRGYIVNVTHENTVRLLPPLVITTEEVEGFLRVCRSFSDQ